MKFPDEVEEQIEAEILRPRDSQAAGAATGVKALEQQPGLAEKYLSLLRTRANGEADLDGLVIVLDCANGAASRLAPELFVELGARAIVFHASPDGRNINAGCGSLHPEAMCRAVAQNGAQLGVAFDGDADRAIFSTATGHLVDGDGVLYLAARSLKASGRLRGGVVVGTTMTNLGLERALARDGISLVRVPVGDRYVLEEMLRRGANLGGEPSGHIIFLDDGPAGDGIATALKVAAAVSRDESLEKLVAGLTLYPQRIVNVRVAEKPPLESLPEVARLADEARGALGETGRLVLRYPGTESLAPVLVRHRVAGSGTGGGARRGRRRTLVGGHRGCHSPPHRRRNALGCRAASPAGWRKRGRSSENSTCDHRAWDTGLHRSAFLFLTRTGPRSGRHRPWLP